MFNLFDNSPDQDDEDIPLLNSLEQISRNPFELDMSPQDAVAYHNEVRTWIGSKADEVIERYIREHPETLEETQKRLKNAREAAYRYHRKRKDGRRHIPQSDSPVSDVTPVTTVPKKSRGVPKGSTRSEDTKRKMKEAATRRWAEYHRLKSLPTTDSDS